MESEARHLFTMNLAYCCAEATTMFAELSPLAYQELLDGFASQYPLTRPALGPSLVDVPSAYIPVMLRHCYELGSETRMSQTLAEIDRDWGPNVASDFNAALASYASSIVLRIAEVTSSSREGVLRDLMQRTRTELWSSCSEWPSTAVSDRLAAQRGAHG
ncbi:hypothetical protein [Streptomyces sp. NBC_00467]|uniref:hypothetical protein n=1 Tax=Streptomyces sp. NBC_00467 TaxID=2975752 RepID=UPI002E19455F